MVIKVRGLDIATRLLFIISVNNACRNIESPALINGRDKTGDMHNFITEIALLKKQS